MCVVEAASARRCVAWVVATGLVGLLCVTPASGDADAAVRRLADPDPAVRREAMRDLVELGVSARDALVAAADDPTPAIHSPAGVLLRRLDAGVNEVPPPLRDTFGPLSLIELARGGLPRTSFLTLYSVPAASAPGLARDLVEAVDAGRDIAMGHFGLADALCTRGNPTASTEAHLADRPAVVAAVARRDGGEGLYVRAWLDAAAAFSRREGGGDAGAAHRISQASSAADAGSATWMWVRGQNLPDPRAGKTSPDVVDLAVTRAARDLLRGNDVDVSALPDGPARNAALFASAIISGESLPELTGDDAVTLALAGRVNGAVAAADAIDQTGLQWAAGRLEELVGDGPAAGLHEPDERAWRAARDTLVNRILRRSVDATREEVTPYHMRAADAADALITGDDALASHLDALRLNDPTEAGWTAALADLEGDAAGLQVAWLMPLDDPDARLRAADLRLALAPDDAARHAALGDATDAVAWGLLREPADHLLLGAQLLNHFRQATRLADEAGDPERALRLTAAAVMLLHRPDVARELDLLRRRWPPSGVPAQTLTFVADARRFRMLIAQRDGRDADAAAEFDAALALSPLDVQLVIDRVRHLDAVGRPEEAGKLFATSFRIFQGHIAWFNQSAVLHNQAAWLAARCGRRLDMGRRYVATAITLHPHNAAYIDTLGEVLHRQGETRLRDEAMREALLLSRDAEYPLHVRRLREMHGV